MKKRKRLAAIALAAACAVSMLAVPAQAAAKPEISQQSAIIEKGGTLKLKVKNTKKKVKWSSSKPGIAAVSAKGVVKAKKNGTTKITGSIGKKKYICWVKVENPKLSASKKTVLKGQNFILKISPTTRNVTWKASGKNIVSLTKGTVDKDTTLVCDTAVVMVKGLKAGTSTITAKAGTRTYKCKVTVTTKRKKAGAFTEAMAGTAMGLFRNTAKKENGNLLISPDSVITAVMLAENGAAGGTLKEMKAATGGLALDKYNKGMLALHKRLNQYAIDDVTDDEKMLALQKRLGESGVVQYNNANALWYKSGKIQIKKNYLDVAKKYYQAEVSGEPFTEETVQKVNSWVEKKTNGKIKNILDGLKESDRAVITNAVYFNAEWESPYHETVMRKFTSADKATKKVKMLEGRENAYVTAKGAEGFIKPYNDDNFAFLALLPPKGTTAKKFASSLAGKDWIDAYRNRVTDNLIVETRIPEFQYDYNKEMSGVLKAMGVKKAFSDFADFSNMASEGIRIDQILHKTFIRVDKEGTEAAAATSIIMPATAMLHRTIEQNIVKKVYLNRPFVYAIIDTKTGIPLFVGILEQVE